MCETEGIQCWFNNIPKAVNNKDLSDIYHITHSCLMLLKPGNKSNEMFYNANDLLKSFKNEVLKVSDTIWMNIKSVRYDTMLWSTVERWIALVGQIRSYVDDEKLAKGCQDEYERLMYATQRRFERFDIDRNTCLQLHVLISIIQNHRTNSFYFEKEKWPEMNKFVNAVPG
eukprot:295732_1